MVASKNIVYDTVWLKKMAEKAPETKAVVLNSYQKLKKKLQEVEKSLYLAKFQIRNAHKVCDDLDVPKSDSASVGRRLLWFSKSKRESFKTKQNTDGYPPDVYNRMMKELEDLRTPPPAAKKKKSYQGKMNILEGEL